MTASFNGFHTRNVNRERKASSEPDPGASAEDIIGAIERNLAQLHPYSCWTVGTTNDPDRQERKHDFPGFWRVWDCGDPDTAATVVNHFLNRGMRKDDNTAKGRVVYMF